MRFVYSMINSGMGLCVLPQEADRLNAGAGSLWVPGPFLRQKESTRGEIRGKSRGKTW